MNLRKVHQIVQSLVQYLDTQHPDFEHPRYCDVHKVFLVREQLYPEHRGYTNHVFQRYESAVKFYQSKLEEYKNVQKQL